MKKKIIEKIIAQQQEVVAHLRKAMEHYRETSDLDEDETMDPEDMSLQSVAKDMQLRMDEQRMKAKNDLNKILEYQDLSCDEVEPGALIFTAQKIFFVGISIQLEYDHKDVICFSTEAPIYKLNIGKKKGDEFVMGDRKFKIEEIQ